MRVVVPDGGVWCDCLLETFSKSCVLPAFRSIYDMLYSIVHVHRVKLFQIITNLVSRIVVLLASTDEELSLPIY